MENKTERPFIAERLGVNVNERFCIKGMPNDVEFSILWDGTFVTWNGNNVAGSSVAFINAINNPELVIRKKLTDKDLEFCKQVGAEYVTAESAVNRLYLSFWDGVKPVLKAGSWDFGHKGSEHSKLIGSLYLPCCGLFERLADGDLIEVKDYGKVDR